MNRQVRGPYAWWRESITYCSDRGLGVRFPFTYSTFYLFGLGGGDGLGFGVDFGVGVGLGGGVGLGVGFGVIGF